MFQNIGKKIKNLFEGNNLNLHFNVNSKCRPIASAKEHEEKQNINGKFEILREEKGHNLLIGYLVYENNEWKFYYSEEFKKKNYKPISIFPDLNKVYSTQVLWPFFSYRIPSLKRQDIQQILKKENIKEDDLISLLKKFGEKTVFNHFILKSVS